MHDLRRGHPHERWIVDTRFRLAARSPGTHVIERRRATGERSDRQPGQRHGDAFVAEVPECLGDRPPVAAVAGHDAEVSRAMEPEDSLRIGVDDGRHERGCVSGVRTRRTVSCQRKMFGEHANYRMVDRLVRDAAAERDALVAGIFASPAAIAPKYFYDALGCALFGAICELPEYYPRALSRRS